MGKRVHGERVNCDCSPTGQRANYGKAQFNQLAGKGRVASVKTVYKYFFSVTDNDCTKYDKWILVFGPLDVVDTSRSIVFNCT